MAIPKKGSRWIVVDGERFRWLIRRKATYCQADYGTGKLHVAMQHADERGATLVVDTDRPHPADWATKSVHPITPSDVAGWIRQAIDEGWEPQKPGPQFVMEAEAK